MSYSAYIAAHRFGLGASASQMKDISKNPQAWVRNQIKRKRNVTLKSEIGSTDDVIKQIVAIRGVGADERRKIIQKGVTLYQSEMASRFKQALDSDYPFLERLVLFWSNHFTVSFKGKPHIAPITGAFEREAIRPHIQGKFSDMLKSAVQHPTMLTYLDNAQSIGPNSQIGQRRSIGLNENLAREILELHTLGVNGGYVQNDVIGLAKILTGWTLEPPRRGGGGFRYIHQAHEPGDHVLLGKTYKEARQKQGLEALNDLALHPSTARFIATKLARHFISDSPSEKVIKTLSQNYLAHDSDLNAVYKTLIDLTEAWQPELTKVKHPYEMIISSFRMVGAKPKESDFKHILNSLALFDQSPFQAPSPAGWSDKTDDWLSPNAMLNRVEWCHAFALAIRPKTSPSLTAKAVLGNIADKQTLFWIDRAPTPEEGLALLLASPQWQRR